MWALLTGICASISWVVTENERLPEWGQAAALQNVHFTSLIEQQDQNYKALSKPLT
jgi:hypothetical protein